MNLGPVFPVLDFAGTFVFALSGSIAAARKNMDVYGSVILAIVTALGGGMIRDVLLGRTPPGAFQDIGYLVVAFAGSLSVFFLYDTISRLHHPLRVLDALGLGAFTVIGVTIAVEQGATWFGAILLGIMSGTGGGMIRDVLSQEVPLVLQREVYAVASLVGALLNVVLLRIGLAPAASALISAGVISGIRILSVEYDWHLPRAAWQKPKE
ncbi:trimeric intracellular cation channel family protein [Spirochaeta lutea]|uniref:Glycine transporter domain-containing protein n=1 Tax=Spirochaeta lutea TaxID=1480694 RepID=A0A098QWN0_9SPIO|nr:trimeric intracellular cation channel family protein [Spirochaeta lutea]KGE71971.1 hypothetical protein DC28_09260 [Spirochaeta lutea]